METTDGRLNRLKWAPLLIIAMLIAASVSLFWREAPEGAIVALRPDLPVTLRATADRNNTLRFRPGVNQYFRIHVQGAPLTEVSATLYGPDRQIARSTSCSRDAIRISEVSETEGWYRLQIHSCDPRSDSQIQVTLLPPRTAVEVDRLRARAERITGDAVPAPHANPGQRAADLSKNEEALAIWERLGDRVEEVRTLQSVANLYRDTGDLDRALEYLARGLRTAEVERLEADRASILRDIATIFLRKQDKEMAMEHSSRALDVSRSIMDQDGVAEGLLARGDVRYFTGDLEGAAEDALKASEIWTDLHYRRGQARSFWDLATIDSDRNEFKTALKHAQQAQSLFDILGDNVGRARSSFLLGHILSSTGRKQEALDFFARANGFLAGSESKDLATEAMVLNGFAQAYADLGDCASALPYARLALEKHKILGDQARTSFDLHLAGFCYLALRDLSNAQDFLEQALRGFRILPNPRREAFCWRDLGIVHQQKGETEKAILELNRSLDISRSTKDLRLEGQVLLALGRVQEEAGRGEDALRLYGESRQRQKATDDPLGETTALYHMALCLQRMGQISQSIDISRTAITIIEKLRTSLASSGLRTFYFASVRQHFDLYIDSLMLLGGAPAAQLAFEASERARARSLLDSIREARLSISESVDPNLAELRARIDAESERLLNGDYNFRDRSELSDALHRLNTEYDQRQGQLLSRNSQYSALVQPRLLQTGDIQERVVTDDSTLLLEYVLSEHNGYLFAVTHEDFASFRLTQGRAEIESKVSRLLRLLTLPSMPDKKGDYQAQLIAAASEYQEVATDLGRILLGPVADRLKNRRLVIVADGALQYLPFAVLAKPQSSASSFVPLIVQHEIVNLPSASTLDVIRSEALLRIPPDRSVAIFADTVVESTDFRITKRELAASAAKTVTLRGIGDTPGGGTGLHRLPSTKREGEAILTLSPGSRLALGFQATKAAAMSEELKHYRIIHFATHAIRNDVYPDLSALVLSLFDQNGDRQDGYLRLRDMYSLKLSADLVVLSACETGLGKEVKGEGLLSMVRGFMYSGTPRVLASLWKVDDKPTAELMTEFYRQLLEKKLTPAAALRQAQIAQMGMKSSKLPYYWAGFQLHGDWQ